MEDKSPFGTFTQVPNVFLETCDLPESAQILFLRLLRHVGHTGGTFTGATRKLASLVRMSKSTVDRMVKRLKEAHLIDMERKSGDEMIITLKMDDLWNVNRHHCKVATVPNWDSELPECPKLGQCVPERDKSQQSRPKLGQNVPGSSSKSGVIPNTSLTNKDNTGTSPSKMGQIRIAMRECLRLYGDEHNSKHLERAHTLYQQSGLSVPEFRQKVDSAVSQTKVSGGDMAYFFSVLDHSCRDTFP